MAKLVNVSRIVCAVEALLVENEKNAMNASRDCEMIDVGDLLIVEV